MTMLADVQTVLLKEGIVGAPALERANADRESRGGSLVEALVRLSLADESVIARCLASAYSLPLAESVQFDNLPVFVTRLLPPNLARTHRAIPLMLDRGVLHVALSDPTNRRALETIAATTGYIASPVVAPVSLIASAITRYYPVGPEAQDGTAKTSSIEDRPRSVFSHPPPATTPAPAQQTQPSGSATGGELEGLFSSRTAPSNEVVTLDKAKKTRSQSPGEIAQAVLQKMRDDEARAVPLPPGPRTEPLSPAAGSAPIKPPAKDGQAVSSPTRASPAATSSQILGAEQALAAIQEASSRDEIAQVIVRYAAQLLPRAVLLAVKNDLLVGWAAAGAEIGDIQVKGIMVPLGSPSVIKTVRETGTDYFGTMPRTVVNETFLTALGRIRPEQVVLIPINVRHRPVAILYGDCANAPGFVSDLSALHLFAVHAGAAFERILLDRKIHKTIIR
ncbi:MAG: hypothetical protein HXY20_09990 [Acidobacteria bacterium]|nr:hypothetical protein [Acidobacteriota bacterium]